MVIIAWTKKFMLRPVAHCSSGCMRKSRDQQAVSRKAVDFSPFTIAILLITMKDIIYLSFVTSSISFSVTETKIFKPLREWIKSKNGFLGELVSCGYCFGHWIAFALVAIYQPNFFETWWLKDYFFTALVIAWLSAFQWIVICLINGLCKEVNMGNPQKGGDKTDV